MCGGIAAYKAAEICRRLMDAGAVVAPVLTSGATHFIGEQTLSALASEPVRTSLWGTREPIPHTVLGQGADLVVVAPATARLIGSYAAGISSDLLTATLLATRAPVLLAPAMHTEMWEHPAVVANMATLVGRGVHVVGPATGRLAGGDAGAGRLAEPVDVVAAAEAVLGPGSAALAWMTAVVTAGGTREPIDPVRYLGNRSSGKQGHAVAAALAGRGARVHLVTTADLAVAPGGSVSVEKVSTAAEMQAVVERLAPDADVIVMAAAVADFRARVPALAKLKKAAGVPALVLEPTPDILAALGADRPRAGQLLVGFAAETPDPGMGPVDPDGPVPSSRDALVALAVAKLRAKHADLVVANDVAAAGAGFAHDTNAVTIVAADGVVVDVPLAPKAVIAEAVVDALVAYGDRRRPHEEH